MAIAFRKPFMPESQARRDSVDLSGARQTAISCPLCATEYVLIYPGSSGEAQLANYINAVHMGMQNCQAHPPYIELNF